jgi:intracellular multiplication protein IcmG
MAENDQNNDEYKFAELDSYDTDLMGETNKESPSSFDAQQEQEPKQNDVMRKALIVIGIVIFIMVAYKIIVSFYFSGKKEVAQTKPSIPPVTQVTPQPVQQTTSVTPVPTPVQQTVIESDPDLKKKVSAIELMQQSVRSEITSVSDQVNSVSNNINALNAQISKMNQIIESLSAQVTKQSEVINVLIVKSQPKRVVKVARPMVQRIFYYIQAVIPGRAWLIGTNGSTLTVREGSKIPGYGVVKLIDSIQGRVLTSSGQVIRFSQDDS